MVNGLIRFDVICHILYTRMDMAHILYTRMDMAEEFMGSVERLAECCEYPLA
jgi:hypothetical protein